MTEPEAARLDHVLAIYKDAARLMLPLCECLEPEHPASQEAQALLAELEEIVCLSGRHNEGWEHPGTIDAEPDGLL